MSPDRAALEKSLKINGTSGLKSNGDVGKGSKIYNEYKKESYEQPIYTLSNNIKNRQIYSSPVSNVKGINLNAKNSSNFNYWNLPSNKISKDRKAPMFEMNGKSFGQIQPPPYK